jgi:threonyl-tRNA synthetase
VVLPVSYGHHAYAVEVVDRLRSLGVRARVEGADETIKARIRKTRMAKVPYVLVVGDDDVAAATVGVNRRGASAPERGVGIEEFAAHVLSEIGIHGSPEGAVPDGSEGPGGDSG